MILWLSGNSKSIDTNTSITIYNFKTILSTIQIKTLIFAKNFYHYRVFNLYLKAFLLIKGETLLNSSTIKGQKRFINAFEKFIYFKCFSMVIAKTKPKNKKPIVQA